MTSFTYSHGVLDACEWSDGYLRVAGWALAHHQPIDELAVLVNGALRGRVGPALLPSPDIAAVWPQMANADKCRFDLEIRVEEDAIRDELISVVPMFGAIPGLPLERYWPLRFARPSAAISDRVGEGDFVHTAFEFLSIFRMLADLGRDESILDVGCGLGRIAFGLAHHLSKEGSYEGFDVSKDFVDMARQRFSSLANFHFHAVDVANAMYNPRGHALASRFEFPFGVAKFDFAFLTSVFTHMLPGDVENYLAELTRVLKPHGRAIATFFVMDEVAASNVRARTAALNLDRRRFDGCWTKATGAAEEAIAYPIEQLHGMVARAGLKIMQLHPGSWSGRQAFLTFQDVLVLSPG